MSVVLLADRRRDRVFADVAEFVTSYGFACGLPDETGRPRVMASVIPVKRCTRCGCDMPTLHTHWEVTPDDAA